MFWLKRILNIIIQAGIFREYRNKCFWRPKAQVGILESTEISASEDLNALEKAPPQIMLLRILSGKGAVQIMPFRKLGEKCHFLLQFCMRNWSETYEFWYYTPPPICIICLAKNYLHNFPESVWGVLVLLICVQILVRFDCFSNTPCRNFSNFFL